MNMGKDVDDFSVGKEESVQKWVSGIVCVDHLACSTVFVPGTKRRQDSESTPLEELESKATAASDSKAAVCGKVSGIVTSCQTM